MSSRALRKLQREREEQAQLAKLAATNEPDESESEPESPVAKPVQKNAFDFLNEADEDEEEEEEEAYEHTKEDARSKVAAQELKDEEEDSEPEDVSKSAVQPKSKKKGKKKKKKASKPKEAANTDTSSAPKGKSELDEIDLALKELKTQNPGTEEEQKMAAIQDDLKRLYELLAADFKNLNALNEMKRLFGSTVLEGENAGAGQNRRRGRGPQQVDLGGALAARNSPVARQGLSGLALRKNVLMQGNEEWPRAPSGGLGMELVEKAWDFTNEYRFMHNSQYQRTQAEFNVCVESMDPQRMITLLQYNPYHVSTLLQVSEIAKQQGDNSVSADLLERALFTFGRSVQSTFQTALGEGKARFDFRRPENREFWLSGWRYIVSLGQRGTWRTAYEWAKLLLSLDPEEDPYRIRMIIDQLAIRGGQFEQFIALAATKTDTVDWGQDGPNIQISLAMAHFRLKHAQEAREQLSRCVRKYPWIFERLFRELNIERLPKSIWGKQPRTPYEEMQTSSYVLRAKDIWNTPEATTFLVEVVETASDEKSLVTDPTGEEITRNDARHLIVSEIPALLSSIPRSFTTERTTISDPLPPEDNVLSYGADEEDEDDDAFEREFGPERPANAGNEPAPTASWIHRIASRFGIALPAASESSDDGAEALAQGLEAFMQEERQRQGGPAAEPRPPGAEADDEEELLQQRESEMLVRVLVEFAPEAMENAARIREAQDRARERSEASNGGEEAILAEGAGGGVSSAAYDDQANQRWLAGRGMLALKDFIAKHGADEKVWKDDTAVDSRPATEYAFRILQLRQRSSRDYILKYSLSQGAGKEASDLIRRMIE